MSDPGPAKRVLADRYELVDVLGRARALLPGQREFGQELLERHPDRCVE